MSDEDFEIVLRQMIRTAQEQGAMDRTSDLAQLLWCFAIEIDDEADRAAMVRAGRRIYLEARAVQVFPAQA